ncbi:MAG: amidase [Cyanobacteria bacterium P01_F01_bin.53]
MTSLTFSSAHQLAQKIRDRQVSATDVLEAHLAQISKYNAKLNAICTLDEKNARNRAVAADEALSRGECWGALHGVPITVKDIFETSGLLTTAGYRPLKAHVPTQDAVVVARLKAAGAIIIGKTNPAELASDWQGINSIFPRVNNPWNLTHTPGGSSSGSAAAIAAGLSPLDIGDDFGGSVRQPAHFCGIYSLKPTDRRVPTTGHIPEMPGADIRSIRQMLTIGPLARSVEDLRLCLQLISGPDSSQPSIPPVPLDIPNKRPLNELRIAWADEISPFFVDFQTKAAMKVVASTLEASGCVIETWQPDFDFVAAWQIGFEVSVYNTIHAYPVAAEGAMSKMAFMWREATQGEAALRQLGNIPKMAIPIFLKSSLKGYFAALTQRDELIARMDSALEPWDACVLPVAMTSAFPHCPTGQAIDVNGQKVPYMMANGAYTGFFAMSGHPVVVIPIGRTKEGLPIGMQIVGKRWQEMTLLHISQAVDELVGDFQCPPGY